MKDKRTLLAFVVLIILVGVVIALSIDKKVSDNKKDVKISSLTLSVEKLERIVSKLQPTVPVNGVTPVKGIDYSDGKDGKDGVNGRDGLNGRDGRDGMDGKDGTSAPELQIDCIANHLMKKYGVDDFWQATNIKCEIEND